MQFIEYLIGLLAFSPSAVSLSSDTPQKNIPTNPFLLRTKVIKGSSSSRFDGLYVYPHHTGAAQNAAALQKYRPDITWARLNGTKVHFDLPGAEGAIYSLRFFRFDLSEGWGYMTISAAGVGRDGEFSIDSHDHLTFPLANALNQQGYPPWRACLWNHGVPELFFNNVESDDKAATYVLPSSCELVDLEVLYHTPTNIASG